MVKATYSLLKKELPVLSRLVKQFPEQLQSQVLEILLNALLEQDLFEVKRKSVLSEDTSHKEKNEIPGIATINEKGDFFLTARDLKANSQSEAVKRLTYVAIYAFLRLKKDEEKVSRKSIINPILNKWRVNDGNARNFLANDKGIIRENDLLSLDVHATKEAEKFIKEILDPKVDGDWNPSSSGRKRNKPAQKNS